MIKVTFAIAALVALIPASSEARQEKTASVADAGEVTELGKCSNDCIQKKDSCLKSCAAQWYWTDHLQWEVCNDRCKASAKSCEDKCP